MDASNTTSDTRSTCSPADRLVTVTTLRVQVTGDTPAMAFSDDLGQSVVHLGAPHGPGSLLVAADTAEDLAGMLDRARAAVESAAPSVTPAPDPRLVEARQVLVEDVLRLLGVPSDGIELEITELGVTDIRAARRLAQRAVDLLDESIDTTSSAQLRVLEAS